MKLVPPSADMQILYLGVVAGSIDIVRRNDDPYEWFIARAFVPK